mmetsp:Transcript_64795/g.200609  ORF Transcript_64795/g.200609 Transcript_64795/m.200609 type:complete len:159 (-) Transcript_64795:76-552(-)
MAAMAGAWERGLRSRELPLSGRCSPGQSAQPSCRCCFGRTRTSPRHCSPPESVESSSRASSSLRPPATAADRLRAALYQAFVRLAECGALDRSATAPLALPRAAVVQLLDLFAPPSPSKTGGLGQFARQRWWELRAQVATGAADMVAWQDLAAALEDL